MPGQSTTAPRSTRGSAVAVPVAGNYEKNPPTIRRLEAADVSRVGAVLGLARLHHADGFYLVAWFGDEPVGHARLAGSETSTRPSSHPPELQDVEVREKYRRRGVASALTAAAEREARSRGHRRLRLHVSAHDAAAQALYLRLGYVDSGAPPQRVRGPVQLRTGPLVVDDTLLTWEKPLTQPNRQPRPAGLRR